MVVGLVTSLLTVLLGTSKDVGPKMDWIVKDIPSSIPGMDDNIIAKGIRSNFTSTYKQNWTSYSSPKDDEKFDHIIIGGGTSGLVLAHRLSSNKDAKILIVEAGDVPNLDSELPGRLQLLTKSGYDWSIKAEKQKGMFGAQDGEGTNFSTGKILGGTSSIDQLMYLRCEEDDFKRWKKVSKKWSWDNVKEYLLKSENMKDKNILSDKKSAKQHGTDGPVIVNAQNVNEYFRKKEEIMLKSFKDIGIKNVKDLNSNKRIGVSKLQFTIGNKNANEKAIRQSSAQSYYQPIRNRRNVFLLTKTLTTKIIFNKDKEATGVEVMKDNKKITYHATREVIICAGPLNTPKLLMLSGIGPRKELKKLKIKELANLPVGKNLQDKIKLIVVLTGLLNPATKIETVLSATEAHTFPYPVIGGLLDVDEDKKVDISLTSIFFGAFSPLLFHYISAVNNYNKLVALSYSQASLDNEILVNSVVLVNPKSTGEVTLKSTNPADPPRVKANFLTDKNDLKTLVKAVKRIYKLKESDYFKKVGGRFIAPLLPNCLKHSTGSDDYWECYVKNMVMAGSNPYGTCAMGKTGVVDENLKVRNVKKLRIVDPSVVPVALSGNYAQIAMLIAEYAAHIIDDE